MSAHDDDGRHGAGGVAQPPDGGERLLSDDDWVTYLAFANQAARMLGAASPEDIASEAMTRVIETIRDGKGPSEDFRGYIYTAVRNLVHRRKTYRNELFDGDQVNGEALDDLVISDENVEESAFSSLDEMRMEAVFAAMPEREARLLRATGLKGVSVNQAAADEGITSNHASVILKRARESFKRLWIQSHVGAVPPDGECHWVLEKAGAYLSDSMTAKQKARVEAHLKVCEECRDTIGEVKVTSRMWGKALAGAGAGMVPQAFATTAWGAPTGLTLPTLIGSAVVAAAVVAGALLSASDDVLPGPPPVVQSLVVSSSAPVSPPSSAPASPPPSVTVETSLVEPSPVESSSPPETITRPTASSSPAPVMPTPAGPPVWAVIAAQSDSGPGGLCYPLLTGSAEPGATLQIGGIGWGVTVQADATGQWQTSRLTDLHPGVVIYNVVYQASPAGASPLAGQVTVVKPPALALSPQSNGLVVAATGQPDQAVEVLVDGESWGVGTLDASGRYRAVVTGLNPGNHTVAIRYAPTGCTGPASSLSVTI